MPTYVNKNNGFAHRTQVEQRDAVRNLSVFVSLSVSTIDYDGLPVAWCALPSVYKHSSIDKTDGSWSPSRNCSGASAREIQQWYIRVPVLGVI